VLDPDLRIPASARLVVTARDHPTLIAAAHTASSAKAAVLSGLGAEVLRLSRDEGGLDLDALLAELGRRQVTGLLVEGGGRSHAAFISRGLAQRFVWFVAPKVVGGRDAPTSVEGLGVETMAGALQLRPFRVRRLGADVVLETALEP
jgi:diaminohydroxyphosphoribosylaminopyrimidine deaminase / 5-amino-6-(5-phosphoribosylamino)uracil reductase